ncbi:MAG: hypothetical protein HYT14_02760 [Candidatus Liptonbacteria bacterium]|nr:hypothetical protein [Candidatus Liptonbacteria bacterium]
MKHAYFSPQFDMSDADLLPAIFSLRSRRKDYVRFVEKGGDDDEVKVQRIITEYFMAYNDHAPARILAHCSSDARFNFVISRGSTVTMSHASGSLARGVRTILGAYFDDVRLKFDPQRTRASARGTYFMFRSGDWKTRLAAELTLHFRRGGDGWKIVFHDAKALTG